MQSYALAKSLSCLTCVNACIRFTQTSTKKKNYLFIIVPSDFFLFLESLIFKKKGDNLEFLRKIGASS